MASSTGLLSPAPEGLVTGWPTAEGSKRPR
jgi:hypothetical protein